MIIFVTKNEKNYTFWDTKKNYSKIQNKNNIHVGFGNCEIKDIIYYDVKERGDHDLEWFLLANGKANHEDKMEQLVELFLKRQDDFNCKIEILKLFSLPKRYLNLSYSQLASKILKAKAKRRHDEFDLYLPENLEVDNEIVRKLVERNNYSQILKQKICGLDFVFGFGGVHAAKEKYHGKGVFLEMDVVSMYPSIMILYELYSRNCEPEKYKDIYNLRLIKQSKKSQKAIKQLLNVTYGAFKDRRNGLYDPRMANLIITFGQAFMLDLVEHLKNYCEIIQVNTDSVVVKMFDSWGEYEDGYNCFIAAMRGVTEEWQKRTGLNLTFNWYTELYQKDVNNYAALGTENKFKGGYVRETEQCPILWKAARAFFESKIKPEEFISQNNNLIDYQIICNASQKYEGLFFNGENVGKNARIFAAKNGSKIFKKNKQSGNLEKVSGTPDICFVNNDNIENLECDLKIDKNWYIDEVKKRLRDYGVI